MIGTSIKYGVLGKVGVGVSGDGVSDSQLWQEWRRMVLVSMARTASLVVMVVMVGAVVYGNDSKSGGDGWCCCLW